MKLPCDTETGQTQPDFRILALEMKSIRERMMLVSNHVEKALGTSSKTSKQFRAGERVLLDLWSILDDMYT